MEEPSVEKTEVIHKGILYFIFTAILKPFVWLYKLLKWSVGHFIFSLKFYHKIYANDRHTKGFNKRLLNNKIEDEEIL